jgi:hypothetical protein
MNPGSFEIITRPHRFQNGTLTQGLSKRTHSFLTSAILPEMSTLKSIQDWPHQCVFILKKSYHAICHWMLKLSGVTRFRSITGFAEDVAAIR